ncbi:hypothetical protein FB45DRAFT_1002072 [Roridomyces roridus]|uniref:Uncharacterized protein n=1 Tax=Roridomyces roridus TaxID=1738132 RepID=A0AAD7BYH1_9AGAR|nr:hypothetical protein FB45DRAFT_1002072 [Roridomyces roridus]
MSSDANSPCTPKLPPPAYEPRPSSIRTWQPSMHPDMNYSSTVQHTSLQFNLNIGRPQNAMSSSEPHTTSPQNTIVGIICCPCTTICVAVSFLCALGCSGCLLCSMSREMRANFSNVS